MGYAIFQYPAVSLQYLNSYFKHSFRKNISELKSIDQRKRYSLSFYLTFLKIVAKLFYKNFHIVINNNCVFKHRLGL